jgi:hypothetical protein
MVKSSRSKPTDEIDIPLSFEYLMSHLFGKRRYHQFAGTKRAAEWRAHLVRIFKALGMASRLSVHGDDSHRRELERLCSQAIDRLGQERRTEQLTVAAVEYLTKIAFALVGEFPDHWHGKAAGQSRNWRLNDQRTLVYVRTTEQRVRQIFLLTRRDTYRKRLDRFTMHQQYDRLGKDPLRFLEWFRTEYPDLDRELC